MSWQDPMIAARRWLWQIWQTRRWAARLAGLACAIAIVFLSLLPPDAATAAAGHDKLKHALAYASLALFGSLAFDRPAILRVVLAATGFGLLLELAQGLMPFGREASWADGLANAAGAGLGAGIARLVYPVWRTGPGSGSASSRSGARP